MALAPIPTVDATFFTGNGTLKSPTGLASSGDFIFVGSGASGPVTPTTPTTSTNTVKAFNGITGTPFPGKPANFDFFGSGAGGITNGIEGVSFDPAGNLYVSALFDNKVVKFDNAGTLVAANFAIRAAAFPSRPATRSGPMATFMSAAATATRFCAMMARPATSLMLS